MGLAEIRAKYKQVIETVPNHGVVYTYRRAVITEEKFIKLFVVSALADERAIRGKVRGFEISREASPDERVMINGANDRRHDMKIRAYFGLDDENATEEESDLMIEAVCDAFRPLSINNMDGLARVETPLLLTLSDHRMFGSVLCHYYELSQSVWQRFIY